MAGLLHLTAPTFLFFQDMSIVSTIGWRWCWAPPQTFGSSWHRAPWSTTPPSSVAAAVWAATTTATTAPSLPGSTTERPRQRRSRCRRRRWWWRFPGVPNRMRCWRNTSGSGNIGDVDDFKMLKKVCCKVFWGRDSRIWLGWSIGKRISPTYSKCGC